jgi:hypothetical protein
VDVVRRHLNAAQVAELAELLENAPVRGGVCDEVLQAAEEGRGMTLRRQASHRQQAARSRTARGGPAVGRSRRGRA